MMAPLRLVIFVLVPLFAVVAASPCNAQTYPPEVTADFEQAVDAALLARRSGDFGRCYVAISTVLNRSSQFSPPRLLLAHAADCALRARLGPALARAMTQINTVFGSLDTLLRNPAIAEDLGADIGTRLRPYATNPGMAVACATITATPSGLETLASPVRDDGVPPRDALDQVGASVCVFPGELVRISIRSDTHISTVQEVPIRSRADPGTIHMLGVRRFMPRTALPASLEAEIGAALNSFTLHYAAGELPAAVSDAGGFVSTFRSHGLMVPPLLRLAILDAVAAVRGDRAALLLAIALRDEADPLTTEHITALSEWSRFDAVGAAALQRIVDYSAAVRCVRIEANARVEARPEASTVPHTVLADSGLCAIPAEAPRLVLTAPNHQAVTVDWEGEASIVGFLPPVGGDGGRELTAFLRQLRTSGRYAACALASGTETNWDALDIQLDCAIRAGSPRAQLGVLAAMARLSDPFKPDPLVIVGPRSNPPRDALVDRAAASVAATYAGVSVSGAVVFDCDAVVVGNHAYALPGTACRAFPSDSSPPLVFTFGAPIALAGMAVIGVVGQPVQRSSVGAPGVRGGPPPYAVTAGVGVGYDTFAGLVFSGELGFSMDSSRLPVGLRLVAGFAASGVATKDELDSTTGETSTAFTSELEYGTFLLGPSLGRPRSPEQSLFLRFDALMGLGFWLTDGPTTLDALAGGSLRLVYVGQLQRAWFSGELRALASIRQGELIGMFVLSAGFGRNP